MAKAKKLGTEAIGFPERLDTHVADLIFVKGRDRTANPEEIRRNAFEKATGFTIPNEISGPDALGEARAAFDDLYGLSNIVLNADLTIAFQSDQTGPLPTLYERIFYSIKRIIGIKRGLSNTKEKIFSNLELKREFLLARMRADLQEAFRAVCTNGADREEFVRELLADAGVLPALPSPIEPPRRSSDSSSPQQPLPASGGDFGHTNALLDRAESGPGVDGPQLSELPATPPAWWRDREPGMTPDRWIETYYKKYIPAGLTRGFFQRPGQDKAFYNALHQWEQEPQGGISGAPSNKLPPDLYIPTRTELLDRQLKEMGGIPIAPGQPPLTPAQVRQGARLYQAARRRLG